MGIVEKRNPAKNVDVILKLQLTAQVVDFTSTGAF